MTAEISADSMELQDHSFSTFNPSGKAVKRKATVYRKQSVQLYDSYFTCMDEVFTKIRLFGPYQIFCCAVTFFSTITWFANYLLLLNTMVSSSWSCIDPIDNSTVSNGEDEKYFCQMIKTCKNLKEVDLQFSSMTSDWKLVCDRRSYVFILLASFLIGRMIGAIVGGHLSDNLGRLRGLFVYLSAGLVVRSLSIACTDWKSFAIFQFVTGAIFGQIQTTCTTLLIETTDGKYRYIPIACSQMSVCYLFIALIAYCTSEWRMYLIFISLLSSPLLYSYLLYQESLRWLISKGKISEAAAVITELCSDRWKGDNCDIYPQQLTTLLVIPTQNKLFTFVDLFRSKSSSIKTLSLILSVISCSFVNSGFILFSNLSIIQNMYLHLLLNGSFRMIFLIIGIMLNAKFSRLGCKHMMLFSLGSIIICFGVVIVIFFVKSDFNSNILYGILLLAMALNGSIYEMTVLHTAAVIYPTVMRGIAIGFVIGFQDLGTIIIGAVIEFSAKIWPIVPCLAIETFLIITFLGAMWYLPETKYCLAKVLLYTIQYFYLKFNHPFYFISHEIVCSSFEIEHEPIILQSMDETKNISDEVELKSLKSRKITLYRKQSAEELLNKCNNITVVNGDFENLFDHFMLLCEKEDIRQFLFVSYVMGHFFGSLIGGHLSDSFGRLSASFVCLSMTLIASILSVACTSWKLLLAFQILIGFLVGKIETSIITLLSEITDKQYRLLTISFTTSPFTLLIISLIFYLTKNWRLFLIFVNFISISLLYTHLLLQESPRWLISKGYYYRAAQALSEIASDLWNRASIEINVKQIQSIQSETTDKGFLAILNLFRSSILRKNLFFLIVSAVAQNLVSLTTFSDRNIKTFGILLYVFIYSLFTILIIAIAVILDFKIASVGYKCLTLVSLFVNTLCIMIILATICLSSNDFALIILFCLLISGAVNDGLYTIILLHTITASFLTENRAFAVGLFLATKDFTTAFSTLVYYYVIKWPLIVYITSLIFLIFTSIVSFIVQPESKYALTKMLLDDCKVVNVE
ncbi:Solute carrier family 22 member 16 [Trichinella zimbabwensis]|uniref:Solute carrier family 22 member 16 n=1 Tax=Trichinella zimbabwensis TaxID=268475 RepID=A0A0V1HPB2_9BILA|nr:Solute carrier family 22 member 16 [Trichinella zimbabwensis]KRZ12113.1 Solute carrier family 22 member 16 [Trichinella zimbabwensis]